MAGKIDLRTANRELLHLFPESRIDEALLRDLPGIVLLDLPARVVAHGAYGKHAAEAGEWASGFAQGVLETPLGAPRREHRRYVAANRSHHPDEPDGVGAWRTGLFSGRQSFSPSGRAGWSRAGARPFSGRQSFSPSGRAGWSSGAGRTAVLWPPIVLTIRTSRMESGWRLGRSLAANRSHHPDEPDGVGLATAVLWPPIVLTIRTASLPSMTDPFFPGIRSLVQCHSPRLAKIPHLLLLTFSGPCQRVQKLGGTPPRIFSPRTLDKV